MEKLQKLLAQQGFGSRRQMEQWISQGRVKVNGQVATIGMRASLEDQILVNDKPLRRARHGTTRPRVLIYHKPEGQICTTSDPDNRPTVFQALSRYTKAQARWMTVGRLDINTSGLLLFTTDGELANRLMHPSYQVEREYAVRVYGQLSDQQQQQLRDGIMLEDGLARISDIQYDGGSGQNHWYYVVIQEGRNREVRRLFSALDVTVSRLTRVRYGQILLPKRVRRGQFWELPPLDINELRESVGLKPHHFSKTFVQKWEHRRPS